MRPIKRLEIVIDAAHAPELLEVLQAAKVPGYTVLPDVHGMGDRGERTGEKITNVFGNSMVIVACEPETADRITERVRPLLRKLGGICLVSDAHWVDH